MDETYRKAKTIKTEEFKTTFDVSTLYSATYGLFNVDSDHHLCFERYRVNMYGEGGFFKAHKDTPRSPDFVGTLVICLPSKFEGGCFENRGYEIKLEWDKLSETTHQWVIFYGNVNDWIEEVTSGTRLP